jgi:hypothetical protein
MSAAIAFERWPQLRDAVPPRPLERLNGKFSMKVASDWAELVQRVERGEYRLRQPAASKDGLVGPFHGRGECLVPLMHENLVWIDPAMPAEDGDLVIVQWHPDTLRGIIERGRRKPEWVAMYGENPSNIATKWLRRIGSEYWLVCKSACLPLAANPFYGGENKILGVARYIERRGVPIYGSGEIVAQAINQEAATEVASATDSSTAATANNSVDEQYAASVTIAVDETTDVFEVTMTGIMTVTLTGAPGSPTAQAVLYYNVGAGAVVFGLGIGRPVPSAATPFACTGSVTGLAVGSVTFSAGVVAAESGATGTVTNTVTAAALVVTKVKR